MVEGRLRKILPLEDEKRDEQSAVTKGGPHDEDNKKFFGNVFS
jgi:hypothetical protein